LEPEGVERKLAAILSADVVGYSRLMAEDEDATVRTLETYREEIGLLVGQHRGRVVDFPGDNLLAEFPTATDALQCAAQAQRALQVRNAALAPGRRMEFRMGLHLGEVRVEGDRLYGDGVNIAARLEGLAEPGGICISGTVHEQVERKLQLAYVDLGDRTLKNLPKPIRVYRIGGERGEEAEDAASRDAKQAAAPGFSGRPAIAVLPFDNMSGDPEQEYFADGVTEDITTALSQIRSFFVIARNSTFTYKGKAVKVQQVAGELGVRYVLEGSVRRSGSRVRVTAQLIDAETGNHIWADRYDGSLEDIFDLQDQITETVVGTIEPKLTLAEVEKAKHKRPESLGAYDYCLRGLAHLNAYTHEDNAEALRLFLRAIEIDPGYGRAYAHASQCYVQRPQVGGASLSDEDKSEALRLANAAVRADTDDPTILWIAALATAFLGRDLDGAMALIDKSLAINPNSASAWRIGGLLRCYTGDPETAIEHAESAMRLSPRDPMAWTFQSVLATAHMQAKRYDQAAAWARKAIQENPNSSTPYRTLAASCVHLGRLEEAREAMRHVLELEPDLTIAGFQRTYPVARYANLEDYLDGLRKSGMPE
jgi:TolB-like protein